MTLLIKSAKGGATWILGAGQKLFQFSVILILILFLHKKVIVKLMLSGGLLGKFCFVYCISRSGNAQRLCCIFS